VNTCYVWHFPFFFPPLCLLLHQLDLPTEFTVRSPVTPLPLLLPLSHPKEFVIINLWGGVRAVGGYSWAVLFPPPFWPLPSLHPFIDPFEMK
jgi:hypothetical protein